MNLTLSNVKQIKQQSTNPLFKKVCQYVIDKWSEYDNKKAIFTEVLTYGCQSGIVGSLIYYSDTTNFYKRYKSEINELLYDTFKEIGSNDPAYVFGDEWDKELLNNEVHYSIKNILLCGDNHIYVNCGAIDKDGHKYEYNDGYNDYGYNCDVVLYFELKENSVEYLSQTWGERKCHVSDFKPYYPALDD